MGDAKNASKRTVNVAARKQSKKRGDPEPSNDDFCTKELDGSTRSVRKTNSQKPSIDLLSLPARNTPGLIMRSPDGSERSGPAGEGQGHGTVDKDGKTGSGGQSGSADSGVDTRVIVKIANQVINKIMPGFEKRLISTMKG